MAATWRGWRPTGRSSALAGLTATHTPLAARLPIEYMLNGACLGHQRI